LIPILSVSVAWTFNGEVLDIVTVEDPPFVSVREEQFNASSKIMEDSSKWSGWIIDVLNATAQQGNFSYNLRLASNCSTFSYGCAVDQVVAGHGDMFFAGAYITTSRLDSSIMTSPYHSSPLSLLLKVKPLIKESSLLRVFAPFEFYLWVTILGVMCFAGIFYATIEPMSKEFEIRGTARSLYFTARELHNLLASEKFGLRDLFYMRGTVDSNESNRERELRQRRDLKRHSFLLLIGDIWNILLHSMYLAFSSITGANFWEPATNGGKLFAIAYSMFTVIVISSYTANLAVHLSHQENAFVVAEPYIRSFVQQQHGVKACVLADSAYAKWLARHASYKTIAQVMMLI
jgi:hypothetical protein